MSAPKVKRPCVYTIKCVATGKLYVGATLVAETVRWRQHKHLLRHNKHHNAALQGDWREYGESAFEFDVLELCDSIYCEAFEQFWVTTLMSYDPRFGYNTKQVTTSQLGYKHSAVARQRMSEIASNREADPNKLAAMREAARAKFAIHGHPLRDVPLMEDHKRKISAALQGNTNGKGYKFTPAQSANQSARRKGVPLSDAHRRALSIALKGKKKSPQAKANMSAAKQRKNRERNDDRLQTP